MSEKKKENPHAGHRNRLRQRFIKEGGKSFQKHELLELILFNCIPMQDTNELAHKLLSNFNDTFNILLNSDYREIVEKCNVSTNTAIFLNAIGEIVKACQKERTQEKVLLNSTELSGRYAIDLLMYETTEKFYVLCLDQGNHLIKAAQIGSSSVSSVQIEVKDVVREILFCKASNVIFVHNHPGGTLHPSNADIDLTVRLIEALNLIHIGVIDHIIVANEDYMSFVQKGIITHVTKNGGEKNNE